MGGQDWEEERVGGVEMMDSGLDLAGGGEGPTELRRRGGYGGDRRCPSAPVIGFGRAISY